MEGVVSRVFVPSTTWKSATDTGLSSSSREEVEPGSWEGSGVATTCREGERGEGRWEEGEEGGEGGREEGRKKRRRRGKEGEGKEGRRKERRKGEGKRESRVFQLPLYIHTCITNICNRDNMMIPHTRLGTTVPSLVPSSSTPYLWWALQHTLSDPQPSSFQKEHKILVEVREDGVVSGELHQGATGLVGTDTTEVICEWGQA